MKAFAKFVAVMAMSLGLCSPALTGEREIGMLRQLLEQPASADMFTDQFLQEVPMDRLQPVLDQVREALPQEFSITEQANGYVIAGGSTQVTARIALTPAGQIAGLFFEPVVDRNVSVESVVDQLDTLPGTVAYLVTTDGSEVISRNASEPLAVGSAFKLGILSVLKDRIAANAASWGDVVRIEERQISLPHGQLQDFPVGSPVTLHTLAALMISISDNTATDVLLDYVGREAVAEKLSTDFVLKTREAFILQADAALRERFLAADADGKMEMVPVLDATPLPDATSDIGKLTEGVEYYVPLTRLCALAEDVAPLDVMRINPGLARPADWDTIAFKGGSEQGVLNFTTWLEGAGGDRHCVAFTWNNADAALDEARAAGLYGSLITALTR